MNAGTGRDFISTARTESRMKSCSSRRLPEAHLGLRGMHVDIHFGERHLQEEQHHRINRRRDDVAVGLGQRVLHQAIADQPAIHEDEDGVAIELLDLGPRNEAVQLHLAAAPAADNPRLRRHGGGCGRPTRSSGSSALKRDQLVERLLAEDLVDALRVDRPPAARSAWRWSPSAAPSASRDAPARSASPATRCATARWTRP